MISTFEQDLRLLTVEQLTAKYGDRDWKGYLNGNFTKPLAPLEGRHIDFASECIPLPVPEEEEPAAPPYTGRAFGKFVMIRRLESEHSGRLVMPERISGTSDVGFVASVGEETKYIKAGMVVLFDQYAGVGRECRLIDENALPGDFLIVEEGDVLAILEKVR
jgi:co-chaperonin GroES (HSP10)